MRVRFSLRALYRIKQSTQTVLSLIYYTYMQLGVYRHYKQAGHLYQIIGLAIHTETNEEMVIYKPLYKIENLPDNTLFVRPKKMFLEDVEVGGKKIPRFTYLHP